MAGDNSLNLSSRVSTTRASVLASQRNRARVRAPLTTSSTQRRIGPISSAIESSRCVTASSRPAMFSAAITKATTARARASRWLRTRAELSLMMTQASVRLSASLSSATPSWRSANTSMANRNTSSKMSHGAVSASGIRMLRTKLSEKRALKPTKRRRKGRITRAKSPRIPATAASCSALLAMRTFARSQSTAGWKEGISSR